MKYYVKIMPREAILDTQGRVVEDFLKRDGFPLTSCRVGKLIELDLGEINLSDGIEKVELMLKKGLYNPLIEKYEIQHD